MNARDDFAWLADMEGPHRDDGPKVVLDHIDMLRSIARAHHFEDARCPVCGWWTQWTTK